MMLPALQLAALLAVAGVSPNTSPTIELRGGGHVDILSAYLRTGADTAIVSGLVRRDSLWAGPARGHLHVTAFAADGSVLALRATRWTAPILQRAASSYSANLGVAKADVARIRVSHVAGRHQADEAAE